MCWHAWLSTTDPHPAPSPVSMVSPDGGGGRFQSHFLFTINLVVTGNYYCSNQIKDHRFHFVLGIMHALDPFQFQTTTTQPYILGRPPPPRPLLWSNSSTTTRNGEISGPTIDHIFPLLSSSSTGVITLGILSAQLNRSLQKGNIVITPHTPSSVNKIHFYEPF